MPHVGNDVVDLADPGKKGKSRDVRFISRVFTAGERERIFGSARPEETLWTLWAGKEAAYKVAVKTDPGVCSIPRAYPVEWNRQGEGFLRAGTVQTPAGPVFLRVFREGDALHVIATDSFRENLEEIVAGIASAEQMGAGPVPSDEQASFLVRELLLRRLSECLGRSTSEMDIRRIKGPRGLGPPRVWLQGKPSALDVSLSHDGRFVACAFSRLSSEEIHQLRPINGKPPGGEVDCFLKGMKGMNFCPG